MSPMPRGITLRSALTNFLYNVLVERIMKTSNVSMPGIRLFFLIPFNFN
jgi:hypothetical protein